MVLVPLGEVMEQISLFENAARSGTIYVVCAVGGRSGQAVDYLLAQGMDAVNVAGGTNAWIDAGKPVITGGDAA